MSLTDLIPGVGMLKTIMIVATVTSLVSAGVGTERYFAGKRAGVKTDKARSDLVIYEMIEMHRTALDEANAKADAITATWQAKFKEAQDALATQSKKYGALSQRYADVAGAHDRLRDQLSAVATGGVKGSDDSADACRDRAAALGSVLGSMVRGYARCTADLEDQASGHRALRDAWPVMP